MKNLFLLLSLAVIAGCSTVQTPAPTPPPAPPPPLPSAALPRAMAVQPRALATPMASAPAPTNAQVTLTWNASATPGVAGYKVYQGLASRVYTSNVNVGNALTNTVSLARGATYFFAVTSYLPNGLESDFSNEVAYTATNKPAAPTLTLTVDIASGPTINGPWTPVTNLFAGSYPLTATNKFLTGTLTAVVTP